MIAGYWIVVITDCLVVLEIVVFGMVRRTSLVILASFLATSLTACVGCMIQILFKNNVERSEKHKFKRRAYAP